MSADATPGDSLTTLRAVDCDVLVPWGAIDGTISAG